LRNKIRNITSFDTYSPEGNPISGEIKKKGKHLEITYYDTFSRKKRSYDGLILSELAETLNELVCQYSLAI
jgi:hypothetical protein